MSPDWAQNDGKAEGLEEIWIAEAGDFRDQVPLDYEHHEPRETVVAIARVPLVGRAGGLPVGASRQNAEAFPNLREAEGVEEDNDCTATFEPGRGWRHGEYCVLS